MLDSFFSSGLPILRDVLASIAALVAIYVGLAGLYTWRRQMMGKTDYQVAREYKKAIYGLRNAMNRDVRNPAIPHAEIHEARKEEGLDSIEINGVTIEMERLVYARRWRKVMKAIENLNTSLLEAEASWGHEVVNVQKDLDAVVQELYGALYSNLHARNGRDWDDIIYAVSNSAFSQKIDKAVERIVKYLDERTR